MTGNLFQNCNIFAVLSIFNPSKTNDKLLLDNFCSVISIPTSSKGKESDELLYTVWSLVMVRNRLPAQVVNLFLQFAVLLKKKKKKKQRKIGGKKLLAWPMCLSHFARETYFSNKLNNACENSNFICQDRGTERRRKVKISRVVREEYIVLYIYLSHFARTF